MSKREETASGAEHDDQSIDSVYDFLYHDARRIGSFLAQFDKLGHLQQITSSDTTSKDTKRGYSVKMAGHIPVPGYPEPAEGSITYGKEPSQSGSEAQVRVYDPLWTNALTLLDYLDERGLIQRDVKAFRLGQFVIATGDLSILNASMLPRMWENATIRDRAVRQSIENAKLHLKAGPIIAGVRPIDKDRAEKAALKTAESTARAAMDLLPIFPHSPQCIIKNSGYSVWSTLTEEGMVGTVADLSLKHGTDIPGEWHLLGVLDALPSPTPVQIPTAKPGDPTPMATLIKIFSIAGRSLLGRGAGDYGVTALLLFRKVATSSREEEE
jgi:hypothetical protein